MRRFRWPLRAFCLLALPLVVAAGCFGPCNDASDDRAQKLQEDALQASVSLAARNCSPATYSPHDRPLTLDITKNTGFGVIGVAFGSSGVTVPLPRAERDGVAVEVASGKLVVTPREDVPARVETVRFVVVLGYVSGEADGTYNAGRRSTSCTVVIDHSGPPHTASAPPPVEPLVVDEASAAPPASGIEQPAAPASTPTPTATPTSAAAAVPTTPRRLITMTPAPKRHHSDGETEPTYEVPTSEPTYVVPCAVPEAGPASC